MVGAGIGERSRQEATGIANGIANGGPSPASRDNSNSETVSIWMGMIHEQPHRRDCLRCQLELQAVAERTVRVGARAVRFANRSGWIERFNPKSGEGSCKSLAIVGA